MARTPFNAIQKAVYERLDEQSGSWQTQARVYDEVPNDAQLPYVELGQFTDLPEDTKTVLYSENTQVVNVWSDARGTRELNAIINQVVEAVVADAMLTEIDDDFKIFFIKRDLIEVFKVADPQLGAIVRQGVVRIRFKVEDLLSG